MANALNVYTTPLASKNYQFCLKTSQVPICCATCMAKNKKFILVVVNTSTNEILKKHELVNGELHDS